MPSLTRHFPLFFGLSIFGVVFIMGAYFLTNQTDGIIAYSAPSFNSVGYSAAALAQFKTLNTTTPEAIFGIAPPASSPSEPTLQSNKDPTEKSTPSPINPLIPVDVTPVPPSSNNVVENNAVKSPETPVSTDPSVPPSSNIVDAKNEQVAKPPENLVPTDHSVPPPSNDDNDNKVVKPPETPVSTDPLVPPSSNIIDAKNEIQVVTPSDEIPVLPTSNVINNNGIIENKDVKIPTPNTNPEPKDTSIPSQIPSPNLPPHANNGEPASKNVPVPTKHRHMNYSSVEECLSSQTHIPSVHRQRCYPFTFPRLSNDIFLTALPNHGAGLGHQFGEWLHGPYLALRFNLTYIHTGFLKKGAHWTDFLGFGVGEDTEDDLLNNFFDVTVRQYNESNMRQDKLDLHKWIQDQITEHQQRKSAYEAQLAALGGKPNQNSSELPRPPVLLIRVYRVHIPYNSYVCQPTINLLLRQKYCAARIRSPVKSDLYREERKKNQLVVAFHLRCGDSCYNPFRATPLTSVVNTIRKMNEVIGVDYGTPSFHIFSQPPHNDSAENHFKPVLASPSLSNVSIQTHFYEPALSTLHHIVTADAVIGAQSSFSMVAMILHHTVGMAPSHIVSCHFGSIKYNRESGDFDHEAFLSTLKSGRSLQPRFDTMDDCYALETAEAQLRL